MESSGISVEEALNEVNRLIALRKPEREWEREDVRQVIREGAPLSRSELSRVLSMLLGRTIPPSTVGGWRQKVLGT